MLSTDKFTHIYIYTSLYYMQEKYDTPNHYHNTPPHPLHCDSLLSICGSVFFLLLSVLFFLLLSVSPDVLHNALLALSSGADSDCLSATRVKSALCA